MILGDAICGFVGFWQLPVPGIRGVHSWCMQFPSELACYGAYRRCRSGASGRFPGAARLSAGTRFSPEHFAWRCCAECVSVPPRALALTGTPRPAVSRARQAVSALTLPLAGPMGTRLRLRVAMAAHVRVDVTGDGIRIGLNKHAAALAQQRHLQDRLTLMGSSRVCVQARNPGSSGPA